MEHNGTKNHLFHLFQNQKSAKIACFYPKKYPNFPKNATSNKIKKTAPISMFNIDFGTLVPLVPFDPHVHVFVHVYV